MEVVNGHEAKTNHTAVLKKVLDGEEVIIARNNKLEAIFSLQKKTEAGYSQWAIG